MKQMRLLSLFLISFILVFTVACTPKLNPDEKVVTEYLNYLAEENWEEAYNLLSGPTQNKISYEEFVEWASLADSVRELKSNKIIKSSEVRELGGREDLLSFDEVRIVTMEVETVRKVSTGDIKDLNVNDQGHLVSVKEQGAWKIYLEKLERASYYKELGKKLYDEKKYKESAEYYRKALVEDEDDLWAKYHLAENLKALGEVDQALELVKEVVKQKERIYGFSAVEDLKRDLISSYKLLIELYEKKGENPSTYIEKMEALKKDMR